MIDRYSTVASHPVLLTTLWFVMVLPVIGMDPLKDGKYDFLPAMHEAGKKIIFDGTPDPNFLEVFYDRLTAALGSISDNGNTLLQACNRNDAGGTGVLANPHFIVANANIRRESVNRQRRAFFCILNYLTPGTYIYDLLQNTFTGDGPSAYAYLRAYGRIPFPEVMIRKFNKDWDALTLLNSGIAINMASLFVLAERIYRLGRYLGKTAIQQKQKFLLALPQQMSNTRTIEANNVTHVGYAYPALYGPSYPAALVGLAHPLANQPNIHDLARFAYPVWAEHISATPGFHEIRAVPKGLVSEVTQHTENEDITSSHAEIYAVEKSLIESRDPFQCGYCGGDKHAVESSFGGKIIVCPTKVMGFPPKKRVSDQSSSSMHKPRRTFTKPRKPSRNFMPKGKQVVRTVSESDLDSEAEGTTATDDSVHQLIEESDSDSVSDEMANAIRSSANIQDMRNRKRR